MIRKCAFLIALLAFNLLFSAGCWDQSEIEALAIVRGMAIDYLPGRKAPYLVTLAVIRPAAIGGESGGSGEPIQLYSGVGASIDLAIQQAGFSLPRRLFLSHNELLIIGEDAAKHEVHSILDFVIRNPQTRLSAFVLVAQGMAHEIFTVPERLETSSPDELLGLIRQAEETSETHPQEIFHFLRQITSPGQDPYTAVISVGPLLEDAIPELQPEESGGQEAQQEGEGQESKGSGNGGGGEEEQEQILAMNGTAVFQGDKLAGILNHIEARGFLWLTGNVVRGVIAVNDPEFGGHHIITLFIARSQVNVTPVVQDGKISFRIEIEAEGDIASQTSQVDLSTPEMIENLNTAMAGAIKEEIEKGLRRLQELETDVVGFGKMLNQRHPETFRVVVDRWPEVFSQLEVDIHVKANIRRTGQHADPTRVNR